jgi:DNA-binding LytR/AlgR family response regulator
MIRALIAEDERKALGYLRLMLEKTEKVEVVGEAFNGLDCLKLMEELNPDVMFLDIRMPGMSGIEVAASALLLEEPPLVVFITGYPEHALRAFELEAIDYLVKPIDEARVAATVERLEKFVGQKPTQIGALQAIVEKLAQQEKITPRKIPVKDYQEGTVRLLDPAQIIFAERRDDRRVHVCTADNDFPTYYTVERLEERLTSAGFFRANAGALVNVDFIDHVITNGDGSYDLVLKDAQRSVVTVSRSRGKEMADLLKL